MNNVFALLRSFGCDPFLSSPPLFCLPALAHAYAPGVPCAFFNFRFLLWNLWCPALSLQKDAFFRILFSPLFSACAAPCRSDAAVMSMVRDSAALLSLLAGAGGR